MSFESEVRAFVASEAFAGAVNLYNQSSGDEERYIDISGESFQIIKGNSVEENRQEVIEQMFNEYKEKIDWSAHSISE